MFKKYTIGLMVLLVMLSGCSRFYRSSEIKDDNLIEVNDAAIGKLLLGLREPLPKGSLLVINSLIDVQNLGQTLAFGRIVSDQLASSLQNSGYLVMGMELPTEVFAKNDAGVLRLADKTKETLNTLGAKALVVGSYAAGRDNVYITLRIVDISSQTVISSINYSVAMGPDVKIMATEPQTQNF